MQREGCEHTNWRNNAPEQHTVSTLHKTSGNLIMSGHVEDKPISFTVDMGPLHAHSIVSITCPDLVSHCQPQFSSCTVQTIT